MDKTVDILGGAVVRYKKTDAHQRIRTAQMPMRKEYAAILVPEKVWMYEPLVKIEKVKGFDRKKPLDCGRGC